MPAAARTITHCGIDRERRRFRKTDCMSTPTTAAWKAQQQASSAQVPDPAPDCTYKRAGELCYKTAPIYLSISGFPLLKSVAIGTHLNVHKVGRMETKQIQLALISICTCNYPLPVSNRVQQDRMRAQRRKWIGAPFVNVQQIRGAHSHKASST
jgi:hypothetical protein